MGKSDGAIHSGGKRVFAALGVARTVVPSMSTVGGVVPSFWGGQVSKSAP